MAEIMRFLSFGGGVQSLRPISEVPLGEGQDTLDLEDDIYCAGGCGL